MSQFPSTTTNANVILLAKNSNSTAQLTVNYMRGILYVDGAGFQFQPKNPTIFDGATYYSEGAQHYNNSGGGVIYRYNSDVLNEASCMGLIVDKNGSSTTTTLNEIALDPAYTHIKPIPMELLKFAVELAGFKAKILRLNNSKIGNSIKDVIEGVSPDYAVIGFKDVSLIDEEFFKKGVSLDLAMFAFEERIKNIENIIIDLDKKLQNEHLKIEIEKLKIENNSLKVQNAQLLNDLNYIKMLYEDVINSASWKITKPLREFMNFLRKKKRKTILKITSPKQEEITLSNRAKEIYNKLKKEIDDTHWYARLSEF